MNGNARPASGPLGPSPRGQLPVDEHLDRLFAYAYRLTGSPDLAEDLTQQTCLLAQQQIHQLRDPDKLGAWLLRIMRNAFLKQRRRPLPVPASQLGLAVDEIASAVRRETGYDQERLQVAVERLPEEFRVVVLMFYFEDLSYREIAEELDLPAGTVMSRLSRAKGHLRRMLLAREKLIS
jgi:RNA polymerase sigma-70 factor (ECF subfamily)